MNIDKVPAGRDPLRDLIKQNMSKVFAEHPDWVAKASPEVRESAIDTVLNSWKQQGLPLTEKDMEDPNFVGVLEDALKPHISALEAQARNQTLQAEGGWVKQRE